MPLLLIECLETEKPVPTGLAMEPSTFEAADLGTKYMHCPRCRQVHMWTKEDAWLKGVRGGDGKDAQPTT